MEQTQNESCIVIGAGGHAKVVISTLEAAGYNVTSVYDDDRAKWGTAILGVPVRGGLSDLEIGFRGKAIIAIGNNAIRARLAQQFPLADWVTAIHPAACVHASVRLGRGTVVFTGAVVQPCANIGDHAIINTASTVDHDCIVNDFAHLAPGTYLAGGVKIGEGAFLGIGAIIIPCRSVGEWATVGAGSVVTSNIPAYVTAVGVPARPIKHHQNDLAPVPDRTPFIVERNIGEASL